VDHTIVSKTGETLALWTMGRLGVLLFFVHTSLVLMSSLERSGDSAWQFFVRRAFRIYPLAIVTVLGVVAMRLPTSVIAGQGRPSAITATGLVANLTLTQNLIGAPDVIGPLWSLPLEVQMYAVLPLCFLVACRGVRSVLRLMGIAIALWLAQHTNVHLWRLNLLAFAPVFLLGVLTFAWLRAHGRVRDLPATRFAALVRVFVRYSYGLYLLHVPALAIAFVWGTNWSTTVQWGTYVVLLVLLPVACYHGVEQPGIALGRRLALRSAADPAESRVVIA
jgi:peptidoglycan/LPS O-acetylase OafA/YrhL